MTKFAATKSRSENSGQLLSAAYLRMISSGAAFAVASAKVLLSAKSLSVWTRWNSSPYSSDGGRGAASRACAGDTGEGGDNKSAARSIDNFAVELTHVVVTRWHAGRRREHSNSRATTDSRVTCVANC